MSILTRRNFLGSVAAADGLAYTAGTGHGAFAYRQSDLDAIPRETPLITSI